MEGIEQYPREHMVRLCGGMLKGSHQKEAKEVAAKIDGNNQEWLKAEDLSL